MVAQENARSAIYAQKHTLANRYGGTLVQIAQFLRHGAYIVHSLVNADRKSAQKQPIPRHEIQSYVKLICLTALYRYISYMVLI